MSEHDPADFPAGRLGQLPAELMDLLMRYVDADPEEAEMLKREIEFYADHRETTDEWVRTVGLMREQGAEDAELLAEIEAAPVDAGDLALAQKVIGFSGTAADKKPSPGWGRFGLLAAGVLALVGAAWRLLPSSTVDHVSPRPDPVLLGETLEAQSPVGEVSGFESFQWQGTPLPLFGTFRLIAVTVGGEVLLEVSGLEDSSYVPSPSELEDLRDAGRILWEVEALDRQDGCFARVLETPAWLSGH